MEETINLMKATKLPIDIVTQRAILKTAYDFFCYISANEFHKLKKNVKIILIFRISLITFIVIVPK